MFGNLIFACEACIDRGVAVVAYGWSDYAPNHADVYADTSAGIIDGSNCDCCDREDTEHGFSIRICTLKGEK